MKGPLLTIIFFNCITAFAQTGIYLTPSAGIGLTNVLARPAQSDANSLHYNAQLAAGYQLHNWRIETGIRYFTSGYATRNTLVFEQDIDPVTGAIMSAHYGSIRTTYTHIAIPLSIGYNFRLAQRWALVPMAGVAVSRNVNCNIRTKYGVHNSSRDISTQQFDFYYNRTSVWAHLRANVEYTPAQRLSILAGLQAESMFSSLLKPVATTAPTQPTQYNYALSFNCGVKWLLTGNGKQKNIMKG